ncbi:MAG: hypothetical protein ABI843_06170 [Dokdonella sp.]
MSVHASRLAALAALLCVRSAAAQWEPEWLGVWQYDEPIHAVMPVGVRVAADGSVFAAIDVTHHSQAHATLARFNGDGSFAWTREHDVWTLAAIEPLQVGQVALVGESNAQGPPVFVRVYDGASGDLVWQRESSGGRLRFDERFDAHPLAVGANGDLLVRASDGGDYVVIRTDAAGNALPDWRWASGGDAVMANEIIALPDGGAIVSGQGNFLGGGYVSVRFDAQGNVVFTDIELGEIGNPLGPVRVRADANGEFIVAAALESKFGEPLAQVWKLAADGTRLWTRVLPNPLGDLASLEVGGLALATWGDVLVEAFSVSDQRFRLLRLDATGGQILRDSIASIGGTPTTLAMAPNGRVLVGGYDFIDSSGHVGARMVEFDADGAPCRSSVDLGMFSNIAATASADGWSVLGASAYVQNVGNDAVVRRYDATGPCDGADAIFADGFEAANLR